MQQREIFLNAPDASLTLHARLGKVAFGSKPARAYTAGTTIVDLGPAILRAGSPEPQDPALYYDSGDSVTLACKDVLPDGTATETPAASPASVSP